MWCAQTPNPMKPIAIPLNTTNWYPKSGLRAKTGMTSEMMPKAGRIRMYTSGWPKSQNRCCQRTGSAPVGWPAAYGERNIVPHRRSNKRRKRSTVMMGSEKTRRNWTTRPIHTKTGIRNSDIPGARMLMTVTARFTAPTVEAMPVIRRPSA